MVCIRNYVKMGSILLSKLVGIKKGTTVYTRMYSMDKLQFYILYSVCAVEDTLLMKGQICLQIFGFLLKIPLMKGHPICKDRG